MILHTIRTHGFRTPLIVFLCILMLVLAGCGWYPASSSMISTEGEMSVRPGQITYPSSTTTSQAAAYPNETTTSVPSAEPTSPSPGVIATPVTTPTLQIEAHPRLLFGHTDVETLREQAATTHAELWELIERYIIDEVVGTTPAATSPTDDIFRTAGDQLIALAFACMIGEDETICETARTYLLTYASWDYWDQGESRDLGLAHMLQGNALAYDWLYDRLSPAEREQVAATLGEQAQRMYEASSASAYNATWNNWWRKSYIQNHYWSNNSTLGMASLALLGEDPRAEQWLAHAITEIERVRDLMLGIEDGTWHESISYQNYALLMQLPFMVNLRALEGIDLLPHSYLQNFVDWRLYNYLTNGDYIMAYGDFEWSYGDLRGINVVRFVAGEYDNPHMEWLAREMASSHPRYADVWGSPLHVLEFFHYDASIAPQPPADMPLSRVFPDLEGVIWRTGWDENALVFGLKTGPYGGRFAADTFVAETYPWDAPCSATGCRFNAAHDHDDTNTFYLYRAGSWLAPEDVGWAKYGTTYHNALLIDGQGQIRVEDNQRWGDPNAFANIDGFLEDTASTPNFDYVAADATRRYQHIAPLDDVTRHVVFVRPGYFVMLDNLAAPDAHTYEWISHAGDQVTIEGQWVRGDAADDQVLGIGIAAPQDFEATARAGDLPAVIVQPAEPVASMRFLHLLYPTTAGEWGNRPDMELLADSEQSSGLRVQLPDGSTDDVLFNQASTANVTATVNIGPYTFDGRVAVVGRAADGSLTRLFAYGGNALSTAQGESETLLANNLTADQPFEALYQGELVAVSGTFTSPVTLYAPQASKLTVNGTLHTFTRNGDSITFSPIAE
jgi:hypothetical protein